MQELLTGLRAIGEPTGGVPGRRILPNAPPPTTSAGANPAFLDPAFQWGAGPP